MNGRRRPFSVSGAESGYASLTITFGNVFFSFFFLEGKKVSPILTSLTLFFIFIGGGLGSILERRRWMDGGLESSGRGRK